MEHPKHKSLNPRIKTFHWIHIAIRQQPSYIHTHTHIYIKCIWIVIELVIIENRNGVDEIVGSSCWMLVTGWHFVFKIYNNKIHIGAIYAVELNW